MSVIFLFSTGQEVPEEGWLAGRDGEQTDGRAWMKLAQPASAPAIHHGSHRRRYFALAQVTRRRTAISREDPFVPLRCGRPPAASRRRVTSAPAAASSVHLLHLIFSLLRPDGAWQGGIANVVCERVELIAGGSECRERFSQGMGSKLASRATTTAPRCWPGKSICRQAYRRPMGAEEVPWEGGVGVGGVLSRKRTTRQAVQTREPQNG